MRIVHLTDLHINKKRFSNDNRLPITELIADLKEWNHRKKIDFIIITGDIVDQGGISFNKNENYYSIIEEKVLKQIYQSLDLKKEHVYLIPGNHDINRVKVDPDTYSGLTDRLKTPQSINSHISEFKNSYKMGLKGCENYNKYLRLRYPVKKNVRLSNFESAFIFKYHDINIGIAGFNSSWSCFKESDESQILFGTQQILNASDFFNLSNNKTSFNIGLIHHPFELMSKDEADEAEAFLKKEGFNFVLGGHTHQDSTGKFQKRGTELIMSISRSAFNNNREKRDEFKSGYKIVDFSYSKDDNIDVIINYRKFTKNFIYDIDTENGEKEGSEIFKISVNTKNKKFYDQLKSKNKALTEERKKIFVELSNKTKIMLESNYPNISDRILETINNKILTFKEFNHYRQNTVVEYEITKSKGDYFEILETQTYNIISTGQGFEFKVNAYVEIENERDRSDIKIQSLKIDSKEYEKKIKYLEEKYSNSVIGGGKSTTIKKCVRFNVKLPGKTSYNIKRVQKSIHTLKRNGIWKTDVREIMDGIKVVLKNNGNFKIDIVEFGNNTNFAKDIAAIRAIKKGQKIQLDYEGVLMPGDGYVIIVNPE